MIKNKIKNSSNKSFGIFFSFIFLIISFYPLLNHNEIRNWSLIVSLIFLILAFLKPSFLTPLNNAWSKFGILLGNIISPIVMGIIYFVVVTPIGIIMRILKKDLLNLKKNEKINTYWIEKGDSKSTMKNQF